MAPTPTPTAAAGGKGTNPAPDYGVHMNRIQAQLEARLRTARSFLPSSKPTTSSGAFSALTSPSAPQSEADPGTRRCDDDEEEAQFAAELRGADPHAGLGFAAKKAPGAAGGGEASARDRALRGKLLGKRRGREQDGAARRRRQEPESSDEEPGRSGLGRAKKRARREERDDGDGGEGTTGGRGVLEEDEVEENMGVDARKLAIEAGGESAQAADTMELDGDEAAADAPADGEGDAEAAAVGAEGDVDADAAAKKKRKKRKKKKKNQSTTPGEGG
ncbi:hypothetical protein F4780DRAFT_670184 [Xylariomycetidae sp. FL0641]|nr:hypothetical protein F4780DRAFT_670184 [Xylariomycetidae sp. FL0641]